MKHVNGLAKIVLGTKNIPLTRTFYITGINQSNVSGITTSAGGKTYDSKGIAAYMQYYQGSQASDPVATYKANSFTDADGNTHPLIVDGSSTSSVKAAANFGGTNNRPYYYSTKDAYYAIVKPNTPTLFYSADGLDNAWGQRFTNNRINAKVAKNAATAYTAYCDKGFVICQMIYNFSGSNNHDGNIQKFISPKNTKYKLEVWGAGTSVSRDGKGGYSTGITISNLSVNQSLYVCVGGIGEIHSDRLDGGYNGGGSTNPTLKKATWGGSGGCGATHIANYLYGNGELKNYKSHQNNVLLVAGGAGTGDHNANGGNGGGKVGTDGGGDPSSASNGGKGGTDVKGGAGAVAGDFGIGGDYGDAYLEYDSSKGDDAGGCGGGGWYGGGSPTVLGGGAGGGGSGHINTSLVTNGTMQTGVNSGWGKCMITQQQN